MIVNARHGDEVFVTLTVEEFERVRRLVRSPDARWEDRYREAGSLLNLPTRERHAIFRAFRNAFLDKNHVNAKAFQRRDGSLMEYEEWVSQPDLEARIRSIRNIGAVGARLIANALRELESGKNNN